MDAPPPHPTRIAAPALAVLLVAAVATLPGACSSLPSEGDGQAARGDATTSSVTVTAAAALTATMPVTVTATYTETDLVSGVRQLILEGERSGEGYYSADGKRMIFQSEREPGNPFYQMYVLDLETGESTRVSNGVGKTTCGWFHPDGEKVLFASTHEDPRATELQQELIDLRAKGEAPRYSFEYDDTYEIYDVAPGGGDYRNLTSSPGYDAEGSWSPDGSKIVFTSNRSAYGEALADEDRERFELDPSYMADIYIMEADGSNVQRLTDHKGYDGGPFFSPDGERIVWRSFNAEGDLAEIWTMRSDGSDKRQLTEIGAMSWAPFYHPSGRYVVFATNVHGFANFELYLVDSAGDKDPVRVTFTDGPDVLPVFSPDGRTLSWVSRRTDGKAQIHVADWNDELALELLDLSPERGAVRYASGDVVAAAPDMSATEPDIQAADARLHVERLASEEMEGRATGTAGEARATGYVAQAFEAIGLEPAGTDGYFEPFPFTAGVELGSTNVLSVEGPKDSQLEPEIDVDWRPLTFSKVGSAGFADLVFAGYGIVAPEDGEQAAYDSYGELDVEGKWVVVLRYVPEDVDAERRQHLARHASLRYKTAEARDRGAAGVIVVSGPTSRVEETLVPLDFDGIVAGASIPAVSVSDGLAESLFAAAGKDLAAAQTALDAGDEIAGFALPGARVGAHIELDLQEGVGRNVLGKLQVGASPSAETVVIGAHVDHLGRGEGGDSLAKPEERGQVHPGADDNASGVAGLIEIAQSMAAMKSAGELVDAKRDVVFAAWSGEEMGLLGSDYFVDSRLDGGETLYPQIAAYLNMDMIGRFEDALVLQGTGSSPWWRSEIEKRNVTAGLPLKLSDDTYLPTDATSFYLKGVPILSAFTGVHTDYSTPRDTAEKLDYESLAKTARLIGQVAQSASALEAPPEYVKVEADPDRSTGRSGRVYLGTIPDYSSMNEGAEVATGGVLLSGVSSNAPADKAGLQAGDVIVELAGQAIGDIYDYMRVMDNLKIGEPVSIVVLRDGERSELTITPASRE